MRLSSAEKTVARLIRNAFLLAENVPGGQMQMAHDWSLVAQAAEDNGLAPLLYSSLKKDGTLAPPPDVRERLRIAYLRSDVANWQAFRELNRLLVLFRNEQIPVVILKGAALATTLYPEIAQRRMDDIDLLVPQASAAKASSLLLQQGFATPQPLSRQFYQRYSNNQAFLRFGNRPAHLEVHWHLFKSPYYCQRIPIAWFWNHTIEFDLNGQRACSFNPEAQFVHLCAHFALHHDTTRMIWSYDLALFLSRYAARLNWQEIIDTVNAFGLVQALQNTLARVSETWGVSLPADLSRSIDALRPTWKQRIAYAMITSPRVEARLALDTFGIPGVPRKFAFWLYHLFPSFEFMRERYGIRDARWIPFFYVWRILEGFFKFVRSAVSMVTPR